MPYWSIITFIFTLVITALWVKPWKLQIKSFKLISLLMIDSFAFYKFINLNYYKIFALFHVKSFLFKKSQISFFSIFLIFFSFLSGIIFITLFPDLNDPSSNSLFSSSYIRIFRYQFTFISTLTFAYVLYCNLKDEKLDGIGKTFIFIGYLLALGSYIECFLNIDIYHFLTSGRELLYGTHGLWRTRGFSYEPRGASQALAACIAATTLFSNKKNFFTSIIFFMPALILSASTSGLILLIIAFTFITLISWIQKKPDLIYKVIFATFLFAFLFVINPNQNKYVEQMERRSFLLKGRQNNITSLIINKFEVYDAAYLNMLTHRPYFFIFGTGSGLAGIASQEFILEKDKSIYKGGSALPHMGFVYLIGQFGLPITILLIFLAFYKNSMICLLKKESCFILLLAILSLFQAHYFLPFFYVLIFNNLSKYKS